MIKNVHKLIDNAIKNGNEVYVLENSWIRLGDKISELLKVVGVDVKSIAEETDIDGINLENKILVVSSRDVIESNILGYVKCFKACHIHIVTEDIFGVTVEDVKLDFKETIVDNHIETEEEFIKRFKINHPSWIFNDDCLKDRELLYDLIAEFIINDNLVGSMEGFIGKLFLFNYEDKYKHLIWILDEIVDNELNVNDVIECLEIFIKCGFEHFKLIVTILKHMSEREE